VRHRPRDLARHERLATPRRLMVEQNAVARVHPVALAVIHRHPVRVHLGTPIRTARVERRRLLLRHLLHQPEHLRRTGLVEPRLNAHLADRLQQTHRAGGRDIGGVFGRVETHPHVALRRQVVHLGRLDLADQPRQVAAIGQVAVVQVQVVLEAVRIGINPIQPRRVERGSPADDAVHLVPLLEQQLREVRTILAGDSRNKHFFNIRHTFISDQPISLYLIFGMFSDDLRRFKFQKLHLVSPIPHS